MESPPPLAIITGGTSGIGLATARRLAATHRLALIYGRDSEKAQQAQTALGAPDDVRAFCIDVASEQAVEQGYPEIFAHFGSHPAVLVNSAGISRSMQFFIQGRGLEICQQLMNVNFYGTLRMVAKVLPGMYSARRGAIVNVSSISAQGGYKGYIGYAESKAAVECFTRNLAVEVGHRGLSVNCVAPALVDTPMTADFVEQVNCKALNLPLGRLIEADEVARVIEFLILAGPALNGQNIAVDGANSLMKQEARF